MRLLSVLLLFLAACHADMPKPLPSSVPPNAKTPDISISDLNCWVENGNFFVIGLCNNNSNEWQKIWLRMDPLDNIGNPVSLKTGTINVFPLYADAVAPRGRSSFFGYWPLNSFGGVPDSARINGVGAIGLPPGPILIAEEKSGVKVLTHPSTGDTISSEETRWLMNMVLSNPLQMSALHPRVELLIYGTDKRLWMSSILNPEDPAQKATLNMEREGPMAPGEKRSLGCFIYYDHLPQHLREIKIGRVEFLPFEGRK